MRNVVRATAGIVVMGLALTGHEPDGDTTYATGPGEAVSTPSTSDPGREPSVATVPVDGFDARPWTPMPRSDDATSQPRERPFASTSAWNVRAAAAPMLDPASAAIVGYLSGGPQPGVADIYEFGVPVWDAYASTPRHAIVCTAPWGTCALEQQPVPIPDGASASSGSDGAMVVVDWSTGAVFEFWQAQQVDGRWETNWGDVLEYHGTGTPSAGTGAGVSRLAGVVRVDEMARGHVDHALVFSSDNACAGTFRYPASKTDGSSSRPDCIPQGARIQLDPAIDLDAIADLTPIERLVARALQEYGAYCIDNGGARMAFIFETPSGEPDAYLEAGVDDYFPLDHIPWSALRVFANWDGT